MPNPIIKPVPSSDSSEQVVTPAAAAHVVMMPASALPWGFGDRGAFVHGARAGMKDAFVALFTLAPSPDSDSVKDAQYAVHAANAYPRLIAALVDAYETLNEYADVRDNKDGGVSANPAMSQAGHIEELLKELGE